ncbi:uncharacterized protein LOC107032533 [Solanum pennellii]|uniref:Uncharacterized protein LOC107032533 n=1 Tax=Solanum pennellii TaxID=28526 RepID=A0ABM1HSD5_SOLPN|nr:uncharacterized protein LOC107032533 [Solanum pennellii]
MYNASPSPFPFSRTNGTPRCRNPPSPQIGRPRSFFLLSKLYQFVLFRFNFISLGFSISKRDMKSRFYPSSFCDFPPLSIHQNGYLYGHLFTVGGGFFWLKFHCYKNTEIVEKKLRKVKAIFEEIFLVLFLFLHCLWSLLMLSGLHCGRGRSSPLPAKSQSLLGERRKSESRLKTH